MTAQGAEMNALAAESTSLAPVKEEAAASTFNIEDKERSAPPQLHRPVRPPPISILRGSEFLSDSAPTPRASLHASGQSRISSVSTSTLGKRPRSPNDLLSQLMAPDRSRDMQDGVAQEKKPKIIKKIRWKPDAELKLVRIFERDAAEDKKDGTHGEGLSHLGEGEMLKIKKPIIEWYRPLPLVIPQAYLDRIITSSDAGQTDLTFERDRSGSVEEGAVSDGSVERSPSESSLRSLPPDLTGLRTETATVSLPEELYVSYEVPVDEIQGRQELHMYQSDAQMAQYDGYAVSHQPVQTSDYDIEHTSHDTGPSIGYHQQGAGEGYATDLRNFGDHRTYIRDGDQSPNEAGQGASGNGQSNRYGHQEHTTGRRTSYDNDTSSREAPGRAYQRYDGQHLPLPKAQNIHQRSASNPAKTSKAKLWGGESSHRSISYREQGEAKGKGRTRPEESESCYFHTTPAGCLKRNTCRYRHP